MSQWRSLSVALVVVPFLFGPAGADCGDSPGDAAAVAAARAEIDSQRDCASALSRRSYLSCAFAVVAARVDALQLPRECKGTVRRCARRSTCARPETVTCCIPQSGGGTKCRVLRNAARCAARGGCASGFASCCDACDAGGCIATPTPTAPPPTPTPTEPPPTATATAIDTPTLTPTPDPNACNDGQFPTCGGSCPLGFVCQGFATVESPELFDFGCACLDADSVCEPGEASCEFGVCPPGFLCVADFRQGPHDCNCDPFGP